MIWDLIHPASSNRSEDRAVEEHSLSYRLEVRASVVLLLAQSEPLCFMMKGMSRVIALRVRENEIRLQAPRRKLMVRLPWK